jgi:hypothetical protein
MSKDLFFHTTFERYTAQSIVDNVNQVEKISRAQYKKIIIIIIIIMIIITIIIKIIITIKIIIIITIIIIETVK